MKKLLLIPVLFLTLFAYVNDVKADSDFTINYDISDVILSDYSYSDMKTFYNSNSVIFNTVMNNFMSSYSTYSETYPYYSLYLRLFEGSDETYLQFIFYLNSTMPSISSVSTSYSFPSEASSSCTYKLNAREFESSDCSSIDISSASYVFYQGGSTSASLNANYLFFSNFDMKFASSSSTDIGYETYIQPPKPDIISRSWLSSDNDTIKTIYNFFELSFYDEYVPSDYVEVNLNSYDYIILTLKDYQQTKFTSVLQVQGSLCLTTVYNYGMTPKADYFENYKTQACTLYYDNFTPTPLYVLSSDLQNNAVYYIKSPDISLTNKIKYDSSKFNLFTYNSQTGSEPSIVVNGRTYSPIPYSDLTDTAIISTDEGYISGQVCAIGDINCYNEATGSDFSDIFSSPLELLKSVWSSITSVFSIITEFISILPPQLQTFLYLSFMLAVVLGILKIIL